MAKFIVEIGWTVLWMVKVSKSLIQARPMKVTLS